MQTLSQGIQFVKNGETSPSHASGKEHKPHISRMQMFFKPATVKQLSTSVDSSGKSSTQSSSTQSSNDKETIA